MLYSSNALSFFFVVPPMLASHQHLNPPKHRGVFLFQFWNNQLGLVGGITGVMTPPFDVWAFLYITPLANLFLFFENFWG